LLKGGCVFFSSPLDEVVTGVSDSSDHFLLGKPEPEWMEKGMPISIAAGGM
jgi:hypothetical protein